MSAISFNGGGSAANRALRCFAHTITAGVTAAITSAKTARESKGRPQAVMRESLRPVPSSCGEWQQSGSLLCQGASASHLHFAAHAEISPAYLSSTVPVLQPIHHLRGKGGGEQENKHKRSTHILCVAQGVEGRGCGDRAAGIFPSGQGWEGKGEGNRAVLKRGTQLGRKEASLVICE